MKVWKDVIYFGMVAHSGLQRVICLQKETRNYK